MSYEFHELTLLRDKYEPSIILLDYALNTSIAELSFGREQVNYTQGNQYHPDTVRLYTFRIRTGSRSWRSIQSLREAALAATQHLPQVNGQPQRPDMLIVILPAEAGPMRQAIKYYTYFIWVCSSREETGRTCLDKRIQVLDNLVVHFDFQRRSQNNLSKRGRWVHPITRLCSHELCGSSHCFDISHMKILLDL